MSENEHLESGTVHTQTSLFYVVIISLLCLFVITPVSALFNDYSGPWTQVTPHAGWTGRVYHSSVAMPDGRIVLTGGVDGISLNKEAWRSTDDGATWTRMTASAGWAARERHSSVAMPDGSIVLIGGYGSVGNLYNDTWRSTDNGATWTQMTASAGWAARERHSSVAMPDGSIVLIGGYDGIRDNNDTWRSTDNGATWTRMTASAGWTQRQFFSSAAMPDGSIILVGGVDSRKINNDTWRSKDNGATWTQMTASAGWTARYSHTCVALPDGSIVLMGGWDDSSYKNDVWRLMPDQTGCQPVPVASFVATPDSGPAPLTVQFTDTSAGGPTQWFWTFGDGSSLVTTQNPAHIYPNPGDYLVTLRAQNACGNTTKSLYINVTNSSCCCCCGNTKIPCNSTVLVIPLFTGIPIGGIALAVIICGLVKRERDTH